MKGIILLLLVALIVILLVYLPLNKNEGYTPAVIPFDYESPVKQMQLDKFYEHVIDTINNYDRYGNRRPSIVQEYT